MSNENTEMAFSVLLETFALGVIDLMMGLLKQDLRGSLRKDEIKCLEVE